jgi:hypothetical protein
VADNLSRWLRLVRPRTDADAGWSGTDEGADALRAITARAGAQPSAARRGILASSTAAVIGHRRRLIPAVAFVAVAAAVVTALAVVTQPASHRPAAQAGPGGAAPPVSIPANLRPADYLLTPFDSCSDLLAGLRQHAEASVGPYGFSSYPYFPGLLAPGGFAQGGGLGGAISAGPSVDTLNSPAGGASGSYTSTTNDQETGVDEPDIVKTDGDTVYAITDGVLRVLDGGTHEVTGTLDLTLYDGWQNAELLVAGGHGIVVFGGSSSTYTFPNWGGGAFFGFQVPAAQRSTVLFLDLTGAPRVTGTMRVSGSYVDARLVGSQVRIVVDSAPDIAFPSANHYVAGTAATKKQTAANRAVIASAGVGDWLPSYTISTASGTQTKQVDCSAVSRPTTYSGASMVSVYSVDLDHLGADPDPISLAADADTVYASSTSLYIASNASCPFCERPAIQPTELHRFDISRPGAPVYLGSGSVPGALLSAYSMSESGGYLRVATTVGTTTKSESSRISVLDANTLAEIGVVTNLGSGEQIYAVRFEPTTAYLVTYQRVDPLFIVDLSDPHAPKAVGELKAAGYSTYLQEVGTGQLVSVGQTTSGPDQEPDGLALTLYDVADLATPRQLSSLAVPNAPAYGSLDPHAFLYWPQTGLVVVPISQWAAGQSGRVLVARIDGTELVRVGELANPLATSTADDGQGIQRSLIVNGALWTVSGGGVLVSSPSTLHRIAWTPFD